MGTGSQNVQYLDYFGYSYANKCAWNNLALNSAGTK